MATEKDAENPQMFANSPSPSASHNVGRGCIDSIFCVPIRGQEPSSNSPQIAEPQGSPSHLRVQVAIRRAHNVPRLNNMFGLKFFVTVTSQATEKKTKSISTKGTSVHWNEILDAFIVQPFSGLVLRLYAERFGRRGILIGTHEMISVETQEYQIEVPFVLANGYRQAGKSIEPVTLYLTVIVSSNATPDLIMPINATNLQSTEVNESHPREATQFSTAQDTDNTRSATGSEILSPPTNCPPSEGTPQPPSADRRVEMSLAGNALHDAKEAMTTINLSDTREGALKRIKWVMDTLSPVAGLHPYAQMAYSLLFAIPKTLLEQFQRDEDIRTLLVATHDAFDFTNQENTFKNITRIPRQAQILTLMLQHVCNCCDFIQSYAKDPQFWKRTLKNTAGQVDRKIEDFRTTLLELHRSFLDKDTVTTEITAFQILDDVGIISAKFDGLVTQLKWVSSQVSDAELEAKIREIPYGTGSRFTPEKGCLTGTRLTFLDFIVNWVNDPASERFLVLFGQAGTGKSSIAHEIARRFDEMRRLTSSFIFRARSNPNARLITSSRLLPGISLTAILRSRLRLGGS